MAQPQGALLYYAATHGRLGTIAHEQSLIIDPGARPFDWLVARGMRLVLKTSDSVSRGINYILRVIAKDIGTEIGTPYNHFDAIDRALCSGKRPMVYQKAFDISRLMPVARSYAQRAVGAMLERIPADYSFQNIVLVGGGAFLYRKAEQEAFLRHRIHEVREPIFADVRGFQLAGMNYMRSATAESTAPGAAVAAPTGGEVA